MLKTIETDVTVTPEGQLRLDMPIDVAPGHYRAVLVIGDQAAIPAPRPALDWPVIDPGMWPNNLSLRREDMYGDDGR